MNSNNLSSSGITTTFTEVATEQVEVTLPNREQYFYLVDAAVRTGLVLKNPDIFGFMTPLNSKELYEEALRENIPFHEWHSWVTDKHYLRAVGSKPQDISKEPLGLETLKPEHRHIFSYFVKEKDEIDHQLRESRKTIAQLQTALQDMSKLNELLHLQEELLKKEIRSLDRASSREKQLNIEYMKNILIEYMAATHPEQQQALIGVIAQLFQFTPVELDRVKNKKKSVVSVAKVNSNLMRSK